MKIYGEGPSRAVGIGEPQGLERSTGTKTGTQKTGYANDEVDDGGFRAQTQAQEARRVDSGPGEHGQLIGCGRLICEQTLACDW